MINKFTKNITKQDKFITSFILKSALLYLLWYLLYEQWLLKDGLLDHFLIDHLVQSTEFILQLFNYDTFSYADAVGIDGSHGVLIGVPCNGFDLFALFAGFVIAFPGKIKNKLAYIPIGILIIHFLNIIRLVALAIVVVYYPDSLQFNHKYTFTIIVYFCIFLMWILWVKKFSGLNNKSEETK